MTRESQLSKFMSMIVLVVAIVSASIMSPQASAAGGGDGGGEDKEVARSVELNAMVFPVIVDNKLVNYLFVNARMRVADGRSIWTYREQAHFIRDAVLRATHRESVHLKGDPTRIDEAKAIRICLEAANEAVGETDALISMTFTQVASQSNPAIN